jgi:pimeloyl-ACP methyl ester carboxylesterase
MTSYVLVHGAWSGAFRWKDVRPLLWRAGHEAYSPSLTGLGDRAHLATPETSLDTHVQDVVNVIEYEDLHDIVLVGHSYGGMVVTGVAGRIPERIRHLIYVDAFLPNDGQSCYDCGGGGGPPADGSWLHPVPGPSATGAGPYPQNQPGARRTAQPVKTLSGKVSLPVPLEQLPFSRTYIKATGEPRPDRPNNFWQAADRTQIDSAWHYIAMPYGHNIPWEHPEELTKLLLEYGTRE